MALLAAQEILLAGTTPSYTAVNASDTFAPGPDIFLHVKNTNAATRDVGIATTKTGVGGLAIADAGGTIPATTGDKMYGPFPANHFADASTGLATVTYTATAGVTAALLKLSTPSGA